MESASEPSDKFRLANDHRKKTKSDIRKIIKNFRRNDIHNTKSAIPKTKAYQTMKRCIDFIGLFGKLLGWQLNYKWKSNPKHWITISVVAFCSLQCLYSQVKYFTAGEYKSILAVFSVLAITLTRILEVKCFVSKVKEMTAIHDFSFKLCRQNYGKLSDKLEKQQLQNLQLYKLVLLLSLVTALVYVYHPIKMFINSGEVTSLLPIEIMFIDQSKLSGFYIANAIMIAMSIYSVFIALFIGLNFVTAIMNYSMQVDLIEVDITELDKLWLDTTTTSVSARHFYLRNVCQKCQDKENYITEVKQIFDNTIYLFFCFAYIAIIVCMYLSEACVLSFSMYISRGVFSLPSARCKLITQAIKIFPRFENWIPGYAVANGVFIEMMFYCVVGTRVTIINERLCHIITQSNWYTYDVYSQKMILFLLNSCMNSNELWIGPLAPLSVYTLTEIVKSIYSYYTVLVEVM